MVDTLGITIDRRPKGRPRKMESYTIEKIECVTILVKNSSTYIKLLTKKNNYERMLGKN